MIPSTENKNIDKVKADGEVCKGFFAMMCRVYGH